MSFANALRWAIWIASIVAVAALRALVFPEGGWPYVVSALSILIGGAVVGAVIARRIAIRPD